MGHLTISYQEQSYQVSGATETPVDDGKHLGNCVIYTHVQVDS